jgi:radical SAM superfamily enzyme YgiQ (UPF0313 family)
MNSNFKCSFRKGPVVLVSRDIAFTFPLSYAYLAGYLKEKGEEVRLLFKNKPTTALVKEIMALNPVIVGFGSLYPELKEIKEFIEMLDAQGREFPVVIGGQMVSPTPEFSVKITGADFGIVGEGEITLYQLVRRLRENKNLCSLSGLVYNDGNQIISNGSGEYIEDLSFLPPIPYELFPTEKWLEIGRWYTENVPQPHWRYRDRVINVHGGRGCPFKCNFCYHHSKPRYRPIGIMLKEASSALERFNANMLYFSDDLVLATPKRARELVEGLREINRKIEYSISARFDCLEKIDNELLQEMKDTGCRIMGLGIESGSDRMLKIIGKNTTSERILIQLERLKKVGILPTVSIMIGQDTETSADVEDSIDLVRKSVRCNPNIQYNFTITTPFPGSMLYSKIFKEGILKSDKEFYDKYFSVSHKSHDWSQVVNLSAMDEEEIQEMYRKIWKVYREEKLNATSKQIIFNEYAHKILGRINRVFAKRINRFSENKTMRKIFRLYNFIYDNMHLRLERRMLRLRGISQC